MSEEDMDFMHLPGLSDFQGNADDFVSLVENLEWPDFLTSPNPNNGFANNGFANYEAVDSMETNTNPGDASQIFNLQNHFNDPLLSGAPMPPQAQAVSVDADDLHQSERIDSSLEGIEPMRLGSGEARATLMADPTALRESLGSIELNASRNVSTQQHDHAQGPAEDRTAALADSSQSQMTPCMPQNSMSGQRAGEYFADYDLPEFHHFKVSVKFMSTSILERNVTMPEGCLLHYQPPDQPAIPVSAGMDRIPIPLGIRNEHDGSLDFPWVNEKQKRFTKLILQSFDRGVEFSYREGNIYAKRKSNTKLFWHSNAEGPGHASELKRNDETEVFNWVKFSTNLKTSIQSRQLSELKLPAIWFSFAQKWDTETSTITTKLVWARVDPIRACEMVKNVHPDVKSTSILESLRTSMFAISR